MRAVIQRVTEARVSIGGEVKGAIQHGLAVLLAIEEAEKALETLLGVEAASTWMDGANAEVNAIQEAERNAGWCY